MMKTNLRKMFRDMLLYKGRTILTFIGILIGISAVGSVLSASATLTREMQRNFLETNPASIVMYVANLNDNAVKVIQEYDPKLDIELRKTISARIDNQDGSFGIIKLRVVEDFQHLKVDTFTLEKGTFPVDNKEMVLERDSLKILHNFSTGVGESLAILLPGAETKTMQLSGIVHAPGLAPASMENFSYAFLTLDGLKYLGYNGWYDEIRLVCKDHPFNREQNRQDAQTLRKILETNGYRVNRVDIPEPGKHPHADQLASLLFLLQAFTVISLLAACIIIVNLLSFIMARQLKQIAIMKAMGAGIYDIIVPYFGYVLVISLGGLLVSLPLAIVTGSGYANFAAYILNFKIASYNVPYWVYLLQFLIGIMVPLGSAAYPILKSGSKSVKEGLTEKVTGANGVNHPLTVSGGKTPVINSLFKMPVLNLQRKKVRTILAILSLTIGGVLFMTAQNITASIDQTANESMKIFRWDYDIKLAGNYPGSIIQEALQRVNGLVSGEIWKLNNVVLKKQNGTEVANYQLKIIPEGTRMMQIPIDKLKQRQDAIIINKVILDEEKWLKEGMKIGIAVNDQSAEVVIAGVMTEVPPMPAVYMTSQTYERLFNDHAKLNVLATAKTRDITEQRLIKKEIEAQFKAAGIVITENVNIYLLRKAFIDHLQIIITFLILMAMLAVIVGGLSIASTIGINISERKREIGVLRATGAGKSQILWMVSFEVLLMGLAGWLSGVILSYPVSVWVGNYFGQIFLHTDLQNVLSGPGSINWLVVSTTISLISGLIPAWQVASAPLPVMLAYE